MKSFRIITPFLLLATVLCAISAAETLKPLHLNTPPVIDGDITDSVWSAAPVVTGFATFSPDFGKVIDEQTVVRMAYDRENLYFAYRCFDKTPDKIKTSLANRDNIMNDDWVCLNLDSFGDQQGLYALYVNPLGIQADSRFSAGIEDFSIDIVWYSAGKMMPDGYAVEIRIPLKSLRYADTDPVMMGVIFERYISRRNEHSGYPHLDPAKGDAFLTQMIPIGYDGIEHYTLFEILPAFTASQKYHRQEGDLVNDVKKNDLSLTLKYGFTPDLILDGTINPDFSQIEADAGQIDINLRSSLFFAEKRPFFLEGKDNFTIGGTTISELDPVSDIIYTRTIVDPLAGLRLTGKIGGKENTLASILVMDRVPETDRIGTEQYAGFPILRYKRALNDDSYIGGIFAGRYATEEWNGPAQRSNTVFGLDEQIRTSPSSVLESSGLLSLVRESSGASDETGHTIGLRYRFSTRNFDYMVGLRDISENFTADMGYLSRTGLTTISALLRPKFYPGSSLIQRVDAELFSAQTNDKFSSMWETYNYVSFLTYFGGSMNFKVKYSNSTEVYLGEKFKTGGYHASLSGQLIKEVLISLLYRRIQSIYYSSTPYQGRSNIVNAKVQYQPSDQIQAEGSFLFSDFTRNSDEAKIYSYPISRLKLTYQLNQYLFFRSIGEYNTFRKNLLTDFLASFTYIPGTVFYLGYGSQYDKTEWNGVEYAESVNLHEIMRGFFLKASYLWRS